MGGQPNALWEKAGLVDNISEDQSRLCRVHVGHDCSMLRRQQGAPWSFASSLRPAASPLAPPSPGVSGWMHGGSLWPFLIKDRTNGLSGYGVCERNPAVSLSRQVPWQGQHSKSTGRAQKGRKRSPAVQGAGSLGGGQQLFTRERRGASALEQWKQHLQANTSPRRARGPKAMVSRASQLPLWPPVAMELLTMRAQASPSKSRGCYVLR